MYFKSFCLKSSSGFHVETHIFERSFIYFVCWYSSGNYLPHFFTHSLTVNNLFSLLSSTLKIFNLPLLFVTLNLRSYSKSIFELAAKSLWSKLFEVKLWLSRKYSKSNCDLAAKPPKSWKTVIPHLFKPNKWSESKHCYLQALSYWTIARLLHNWV